MNYGQSPWHVKEKGNLLLTFKNMHCDFARVATSNDFSLALAIFCIDRSRMKVFSRQANID